jgi:hypothetical protein
MNTSLNQIILNLRTISQNHLQLKDFRFCDVADLGADSPIIYPLLWGDVLPTNFSTKVVNLSIQLSVLDIVQTDLSNENDVLSDTLQIISDVINELKIPSNGDLFLISDQVTATPIKDAYGDTVAGWNCQLTFQIPNPYDRCAVPSI